MIARSFRFRGHASLNFVYKRGKVIRGPLLALKYIRNDRCDHCRVAVVVSRKVAKSAVVRNRIRRRIYEIVRPCVQQLDVPYDLVFTAYSPQLTEMPASELQRIVVGQLKKAHPQASTPRSNHDIVHLKDN